MVDAKPSVLIVDDEPVICDLLYDELSERGYLCTTAGDGDDALNKLAAHAFDVVLLDIKLRGISGIEVLSKMCSSHRNATVIMITGVNDVDTAVETMKLGASDYIVKPLDLDRVNISIRTVLETKKRLPEKKDSRILHCVKEEDKRAIDKSPDEMNAIAYGVEAKYDLLTAHSKIITQRTIDIARELGIAGGEIQRWVAARAILASERNRAIVSSLDKLKRSPLAQTMMGMTELYWDIPDLGESQN